jgi:hypothetical protein
VIEMSRDKARVLILGGNGTLWKGNIDEKVVASSLNRELLRASFGGKKHLDNFKNGKAHMERLQKELAAKGDYSEVIDSVRFYDVLIDLGLGREDEMYKDALRYIRRHPVKKVPEILRRIKDGSLRGNGWITMLSTMSGSTAAKAAADYFKIDYFISNIDVFGELQITDSSASSVGKLMRLELPLNSGEAKKRWTVKFLEQKLGIELSEESMVLGFGAGDTALLEKVKRDNRFVPPNANAVLSRTWVMSIDTLI